MSDDVSIDSAFHDRLDGMVLIWGLLLCCHRLFADDLDRGLLVFVA